MSSGRDVDVVVIGGGPGGYVAALRAAQLGGSVALVEKRWLGGTCLNEGCIPTKALLETATRYRALKEADEFGISVSGFELNLDRVRRRKDQVVERLVKGIGFLLEKRGVRYLEGEGALASARKVRVRLNGGGEETLRTGSVILATGSIPVALPIPGIDGQGVMSSEGAMRLEDVPPRLLIIGAGAIGAEFAQVYARLGSEVTVVEMLPRAVPMEDEDVSRVLATSFKKEGIELMVDAGVQRIEDSAGGKKVVVAAGGKETSIEVDRVLVAVGRAPCIEGLDLESANVAAERGRIVVNEELRTSTPGIYAIGDVTGGLLLAHLASAEGELAAENALGEHGVMEHGVVPRCIFTQPEIASVGLTEEQAKAQGRELKVGRFPFSACGKAVIYGEADGFVKIVADVRYGEILGAHIIGPHASDLVAEAALAMRAELTLDEVIETIHPHPTLCEAFREAALAAEGRPIQTL
jgi:dihydrolipoamide dehydrogenase